MKKTILERNLSGVSKSILALGGIKKQLDEPIKDFQTLHFLYAAAACKHVYQPHRPEYTNQREVFLYCTGKWLLQDSVLTARYYSRILL